MRRCLKSRGRRRLLAGGFTVVAVALGGCAAPAAKVVHPQYVVPDFARLSGTLYGYSQAVRVGPWITVSGQVGYDPETHRYGKTFDEQVRLAFADLERVLRAAGARMSDVTSITTYQTDMSRFNAVIQARNAAFGEHRPAWTAVGVKALALPELQFQVRATAYAPESAAGGRASGAAGSGTGGRDPGQ